MKYPHIKQHDEKDCGAACLSMICEYYGLKLNLTRFRNLIKVDNQGANIYGLVTGAKELGINATALCGNREELIDGIQNKEFSMPFIARIINEDAYEHYIVVYELNDKYVRIGDPAELSVTKIPTDLFFHQWQGQIVVFEPTEKFSPKNERKGTMKKYFSLILNQKRIVAAVFIFSLIISGIGIASSMIFQYIIDDAVSVGNTVSVEEECTDENCTDHDHSHIHSANTSFISKITAKAEVLFDNIDTVCICILAMFIIQGGLKVLRGYLLAIMSKNIEIPLSLGYFNHLVELPMRFFGTRKTGELMSRFFDTSKIRDAVSSTTLTIMLDTLMALFTAIILCMMSWKLFIIAIITMIVYALIVMCFRSPIKIVNHNIMSSNAQVTSCIKESIDGMETIKAYCYQNESKKKTQKTFNKFVDFVVRGSIIYNVQETLVSVVSSVGLVILLWAGAYLCINDVITIGSLITFYYMLNYFLEPVKNLINLQPEMQTAIVAAERLNDVLDEEKENSDETGIEDMSGDISIENVSFRYGNRDLVLRDVSMDFPHGSKIAIVGESGCGKTTLAKLLLSFYTPENGYISVGGKNISQFSSKSVCERVSYISQNIFLYSDTIYNNIRMGNNDISDEEIENICRLCNADSFINKLPFGYNTILEENGSNLSGGQKQRLAIARALIRKPDIVIFDEATSNLDAVTEDTIWKAIEETQGKTTYIIIAHRLRTIRNCDDIYVLDSGKVIEHGNHEKLIIKGGVYASYWKKEAIPNPV